MWDIVFLFNAAVLHLIIDVFFKPVADCEFWSADIGRVSIPVIVDIGLMVDWANFSNSFK